jgi:predicted amidophosphoribosyltransferase
MADLNGLIGRTKKRATAQIAQLGKLGVHSFNGLSQTFLAQPCAVCDRPASQPFCLDCQRQIYTVQWPAERPERRPERRPEPETLPVWAFGPYAGSLKRAILAMKYGDRPDVAWPLGIALGQQWLAQTADLGPSAVQPKPYAVPIPLHSDRYQARGYNQADLIAQAFCQVTGLPLLSGGLKRIQATRPQHGLSLLERQQNLAQAFAVDVSLGKLAQRAKQSSAQQSSAKQSSAQQSSAQQPSTPTILLIDDIYTTGASAQSAAATLQAAGLSVWGIATVARALID